MHTSKATINLVIKGQGRTCTEVMNVHNMLSHEDKRRVPNLVYLCQRAKTILKQINRDNTI